MSTTLRIKIGVRSSSVGKQHAIDAVPNPRSAGGSTPAKEFLAMRAMQRARARTRRWQRGAVALGAAGMFAALFAMHRYERGLFSSHAADVDPMPALASAPPLPAPRVEAPVPPPLPTEPTSESATPEPPAQEVAVAAAAPERGVALPDPTASPCEAEFSRRKWLAPIERCTRAFTAAPTAAGALILAHAHWSRGNTEEVRKWASDAVAMGSTDPDAYLLLGHSERRAGRAEAAVAAYRQYLGHAPRGWHRARVRSALRALGTSIPPEPLASAAN